MVTTTAYPDHVGLSVGDLDRISAFYCGVFGLTTTSPHLLAGGTSRTALLSGSPGVCLELTQIPNSTPARHASVTEGALHQGWFHWALRVEHLDVTLSTVVALGGEIITEPAPAQARPGIRFAYIGDPEGNLVELIESTVPEDSA